MSEKKEIKPKPRRKLKEYEIDVDVIDLCLYVEKYFENSQALTPDFLYLEINPDIQIGDIVFEPNEDEDTGVISFTVDTTDNKWNWGYPEDGEDDL